jgi:hypothetical protein
MVSRATARSCRSSRRITAVHTIDPGNGQVVLGVYMTVQGRFGILCNISLLAF